MKMASTLLLDLSPKTCAYPSKYEHFMCGCYRIIKELSSQSMDVRVTAWNQGKL